jgi:hypothetical protein
MILKSKHMLNFELVSRLKVKDPKISPVPSRGCFLYNFSGAGLSLKELESWFYGKYMDIWTFKGRYGTTRKCPWCGKYEENMSVHILEHDKTDLDIETIKLSNNLYRLLLHYLRSGHYEALSFLMRRSCQFCEVPRVNGREGMCAIPLSARNKPRSIKLLGLEFGVFYFAKYSKECVCIVYGK